MVGQILGRSRRQVGLTLAAMVVIGGLVAVIPVTAGSAKPLPSSRSGASSATSHKPKAVEIVGPSGTPLNVLGGNLGIQEVPPTTPLEVQGTFNPSSSGGSQTYNLLTAIPENAVVSISSITVTCDKCTGFGFDASGNQYFPSFEVTVFDENAADCTGGSANASTGTIADINANGGEPSVDFTYPTPRGVPVGFTPSGPWCLGVTTAPVGSVLYSQIFVSVDGSQ